MPIARGCSAIRRWRGHAGVPSTRGASDCPEIIKYPWGRTSAVSRRPAQRVVSPLDAPRLQSRASSRDRVDRSHGIFSLSGFVNISADTSGRRPPRCQQGDRVRQASSDANDPRTRKRELKAAGRAQVRIRTRPGAARRRDGSCSADGCSAELQAAAGPVGQAVDDSRGARACGKRR